jgi:type II secretory pathway predicted ATPase ExeA
MDYLEFFNLKEAPFGLTPDSFYFYPSKMHNDILASLDYAVTQKEGFSLITGEPGVGKTISLKIFIDRWKDKAEIALILTPRLAPEEFLQAVLQDLHIPLKTPNKNEMLQSFRDLLIERSHAGKRVIIIVDEAQNLPDGTLEELRLLSNLETEKEKLLQIILVGQPELRARLLVEGLKQLDQRVTVRVTLRPLSLEETSDYLNYRLIKAGKGSALFDQKARKAIYRFSRGIPRLINLVASRAMMVAYLGASHKISKEHVQDAIQHVTDDSTARPPWPRAIRYGTVALALAILIPLSLTVYGRFRSKPGLVPAEKLSPRTGELATAPGNQDLTSVPKTNDHLLEPKKLATVVVAAARLREQPSSQSEVMHKASEGDVFEVTDEWTQANGNKWYKVRLADGREGWIASYIIHFK